jgi:hypothetical protein
MVQGEGSGAEVVWGESESEALRLCPMVSIYNEV